MCTRSSTVRLEAGVHHQVGRKETIMVLHPVVSLCVIRKVTHFKSLGNKAMAGPSMTFFL